MNVPATVIDPFATRLAAVFIVPPLCIKLGVTSPSNPDIVPVEVRVSVPVPLCVIFPVPEKVPRSSIEAVLLPREGLSPSGKLQSVWTILVPAL